MSGACLPKPLNIKGSFQSDSIITICGFGDATKEIVITSRANAPDK